MSYKYNFLHYKKLTHKIIKEDKAKIILIKQLNNLI